MGHQLKIIKEIQACKVCKKDLPLPPRPVVSFSGSSKVIIIGQAPGLKVHQSGVPWDDASGKRLREWLEVDHATFYDNRHFGIVPMGFCYPGKGKSGDLPPRPECAKKWMKPVLSTLKKRELILLIGQYSQKYFLQGQEKSTLTETVRNWKEYLPQYLVLPHPSPRNNIWLKKNPWFEKQVLPYLRKELHRFIP